MLRWCTFSICIWSLLISPVSAATLYIDPASATLGRGDSIIAKVRIDTDETLDECINAASGVIEFSGPISPIDVSIGESIFPMWVEPPTLHAQNNVVTFAGGIPNGYCGRIEGDPVLTNTLFEIVLRADVQAGEMATATINFRNDASVYLNDGLGTQADTALLPSEVAVLAGASAVVSDPWTERIVADTNDPQAFSIILARDEAAFAGDYYITFNTTDKETGIDHYEIMEEPISQAGSFLWGRVDAPWQQSRSPYRLDDQTLNSIIRVKAVDKAGNEYIANLIPDPELRGASHMSYLMFALYALLGFGAIALFVIVRKKMHAKKLAKLDVYRQTQTTDEKDEENHTNHYDHHT